ncbi:MAG TPA: UvrD-helicase domain-containing protein [Thermosynergistes sp.]|nr:UvrD-helicase domain-containing protein [Thermosynergistes sp.]
MSNSALLALLRTATPSQREAITSNKPFIVVSAGAGTGKTSTLAWRFAWLVATGEAKCDQILTVTYTEKAALEMALRIKATLRSWKESLKATGEKGDNLFALRLEEAERKIEEATISTVHSFSMDLIRSAGSTRGTESHRVPSMPEEEEFWRSVEEALDALDSEWFAARLRDERREWATLLKEPDFLDVLEEFGTASMIAFARSAIGLFSSHGSYPDDLWLDEAALVKKDEALASDSAMADDLAALFDEGDRELDRRFRLALAKAAALLWAVWETQKESEQWLSFDDMIRYAKGIIEEDPSPVRRFKAVLVDEFQDINGVQGAFLESLKKSSGASLFLVGDIKQSIYRFRHADPSIFARQIAAARDGEDSLYVAMSESFRTRDALLEVINDLFGFIWRDGVEGRSSIPYEPIEGAKEAPWWSKRCSATGVKPLTILIERGSEDTKAEEEREAAARKLGAALSSLKGKDIWDKEKREARPCEWKDMAILVPARTSFPALERVLRDEMRLPVALFSGMRYFSRFEAQDASSLLKVLADPSDDLALAGYLLSPFSKLPPHKAIDLINEGADNGEKGRLWKLLEIREPEIASHLLSSRRLAALEGPSRALAALIDEARAFYALPVHLRTGAMLALQRAVDIAHEYEAALGPSLEGCAAYLHEATREGLKAEEVNVDLEAEDAIKVLTVHAAKGLEFPVVAVFGLERHFAARQGESLFPSIPLFASGSRFPDRWGQKNDPVSKKAHRLIEEREGSEEWKRLFYVACTRAQDALLLCGIWPKKGGGPKEGTWLHHVFNWLDSKGEKLEDYDSFDDEGTRAERAGKKMPLERSVALALPGQRGGALEVLSATAFSTFRYCPRAFRLKYRQGLPLAWELPSEEGASGGPELGSLAHWILARWDFAPESLDRFLSKKGEYIEGLPPALKAPFSEEVSRRQLREWLSGLAEGELGQLLRQRLSLGLLRREVPFRTRVGETTLVGIVDALWEEEGRIHIWDYKITSLENAPMELYAEQMRFYGLAWHLLHPGRAVKLGLCFLREGKTEFLEGVGFEEIEEAVRESACAGANGPFSPAHARCGSCPWRNFCFREAATAGGRA